MGTLQNHLRTHKSEVTWIHVGNGIAPCCEVLPALATPHKPSPFCCRCFLSQTPRFDPNFKSSIYCRKLPPPFHFSILITFAPAAAFRFLVPTRSAVHRQRSRTCATVSLTENGCLPQAATRPSAPPSTSPSLQLARQNNPLHSRGVGQYWSVASR
jgi:hypothetical protein